MSEAAAYPVIPWQLTLHLACDRDSLHDEMCRFILWFYVEGHSLPRQMDCMSRGPPTYTWATDPLISRGVPPDVDAAASDLSEVW